MNREKIKLSYNAIFMYDIDGINITFPDIPSAISCADSRNEAIEMAKDVLSLVLHGMKCDEVPNSSLREEIKVEEDSELVQIKIEMGIKNGILFGYNVIEVT